VSGLELRTLRQFHGLGDSETPDVKALPWDIASPDAKAQAKDSRMKKLSDVGMILGIVGGAAWLLVNLRALGVWGKKGKK